MVWINRNIVISRIVMMIVELVVDVVSLNSCLLCCVGCMLIVISVGFVSGLVIMLILD